jgi:hypothetical protein
MMINNNEEVFKMGGWEPVYQDIKYMGKKYTVYNNFNEEDEYLLTFEYYGTPEEVLTKKGVDLFSVNFLCRFDTKFRFEDCGTGVVYEIDGSCEKTRKRVRLFKHDDEDGCYEYNWCREVGPPFDPNFFKVGHPYLVKTKNEPPIPMLLISMDTDALYFGYYEHDKNVRFKVSAYEYEQLTEIAKQTSFVSLMYGDVWKNKKKEVEF